MRAGLRPAEREYLRAELPRHRAYVSADAVAAAEHDQRAVGEPGPGFLRRNDREAVLACELEERSAMKTSIGCVTFMLRSLPGTT